MIFFILITCLLVSVLTLRREIRCQSMGNKIAQPGCLNNWHDKNVLFFLVRWVYAYCWCWVPSSTSLHSPQRRHSVSGLTYVCLAQTVHFATGYCCIGLIAAAKRVLGNFFIQEKKERGIKPGGKCEIMMWHFHHGVNTFWTWNDQPCASWMERSSLIGQMKVTRSLSVSREVLLTNSQFAFF